MEVLLNDCLSVYITHRGGQNVCFYSFSKYFMFFYLKICHKTVNSIHTCIQKGFFPILCFQNTRNLIQFWVEMSNNYCDHLSFFFYYFDYFVGILVISVTFL